MNNNLQENWFHQLIEWIKEIPYVETKFILYKIVFKYERHVENYTILKLLQDTSKSERLSQEKSDLLHHWYDYFSSFSHEELLIINALMGFKEVYEINFNRMPLRYGLFSLVLL